MSAVTDDQIGKVYDLLIATRDGAPISCLDRNGAAQDVSQIAYMLSTKEQWEKGTELQRKQALIQLSSHELIDREFDAWPQVDFGDWSDGQGQRVLEDKARYFDGKGLIWPIDDYLPQQPLIPDVTQDAAGGISTDFMGTAAGWLANAGTAAPVGLGFAYCYRGNPVGKTHVVFHGGTVAPSTWDLLDPGALGKAVQDMSMGHGAIWVLQDNGAGGLDLNYIYGNGAAPTMNWTKLATVSAATTQARVGMATGLVGNQQYVAVIARSVNAARSDVQDRIVLYNVTNTVVGGAFNAGAAVNLDLPQGWYCNQTLFLGDDLIVSLTDGAVTELAAFNIGSQQWRTLSQIPGATSAFITNVAGALFIVARNQVSATIAQIDLYLLAGSSLEHITSLVPQVDSTVFPYSNAVARPASFGSYAIFPVLTRSTGAASVSLLIYAYDVVRGRLFKASALAGLLNAYTGLIDSMPIAVVPSIQRTVTFAGGPAVTLDAQWVLAMAATYFNVAGVQEFLFGVQQKTGTDQTGPLIRGPVSITSPIIDFTSATTKLYRQLVVDFVAALENSPLVSVTLNVWLEQDPGLLNAVPDYTATVFGQVGGLPTNATQLKLPINKIARKLVYQLVTTGGTYTGAWVNAPKVKTVKIQAAIGAVIHCFLLCSRDAKTNGGNAIAYQEQGVDEMLAHNFIWQLWRQRGGECTVTLPDGDKFSGLLQSIHDGSPKPFGVEMIGSQQSRFEALVEVQFREDV